MNENPNQNRREQEEGKPSGGFKLNIDERDLATGNYDPSRYGQEQQRPARRETAPVTSRTGYYASEEERKAEKKAHKKRNRLKARKNKWIFALVWVCMVVLVALTLASYLIGGANDFFAVGRNEGTTEVTLPAQVGPEELAEILHQRGAIAKPEFFKLYSKITVDDWDYFKKGVYQLKTNLDYEDILNQLQGGNETREEVRITFPEGSNALDIGRLLEENEVCTQAEFLKALNTIDFTNYDVIAAMGNAGGKYYKVEGYLFPDTYDFWKGEELESVIGKMINNFQNLFSETMLELVEQSGMTLDEIVTLASIVQGEAANTNDMYNVSAVLHNRLEHGAENDIFFLECDSTIYYPYKSQEEIPESGALAYGNYNTYSTGVSGLPAGAICNPGMDAINAALRPNTEGDAARYLYFCHSSDGVPYYAATSWEHEENLVAAGLRDGGEDWDDDWDDDDDW